MNTRKIDRAANSKTLIRQALFGPPPVLQNEDPQDYQRLLNQLYADLKPGDLPVESFVHDIAHADWSIRRFRRIRTCLIEAARTKATIWVLAMPKAERLRYLRGSEDIDLKRYPNAPLEPISDKETGLGKTERDVRLKEFAENFQLLNDMITARAQLEELDLIEKIDRLIATAQAQRARAYREIRIHRQANAAANNKSMSIIDDAKYYEVVQSREHRKERKAAV